MPAASLAELAETVVVTLAAEGAIAFTDGTTVTAPADHGRATRRHHRRRRPAAAAYIWADLDGAAPEDRLRWAVLYAGLAVTTPTGVGGAVDRATLLREGAARGLTPPPQAAA